MPLTPAHAAAVIPLRQWKACFWLSPLVVGSMAPDYAYFIYLPQQYRNVGHSALGLVLFCIPVGLAVLYAYHAFFKRPLVLLMPRILRDKLWPHCGPFPVLPLRRLAWCAALIYLGAVTHVLWDGVTHDDGWAVREWPQIRAIVFMILGHQVHLYALLQYGSSLLGLALLAWWSWRWYRTAPAGQAPADWPLVRVDRPTVAAAMVLFGTGTGIACGLAYALRLPGPFPIREFCAATFIVGVDAFGLALIVFCLLVNLRGRHATASECGD